ncbi:MAG: AEC family transporter [Planctomycetaceae bacterium]|jgi:predicted permease|nr:AEC family transporter [Planctomycetaceae bacterium]
MPVSHWDIFLVPLQMLIGVYLVVGCGAFFRRMNWYPAPAETPLYKLTVWVLMPCLIFERILPASELIGDYQNLILPPIIGLAATGIGALLGFSVGILPKKLTGLQNWKTLGTFAACVSILNYGFVPIPLITALYDAHDKTQAVLFIQNLGSELSIWTVVIISMSGAINRKTLLRAINPPTCAIVLAMMINQLGIYPYIPRFAMNAVKLLGDASLPASMFIVGISIADAFDWQRMCRHWRRGIRIAFWSCLLRLVVLPAIFIAVAVYAPLTIEIRRVLVIHAAMSSAIFPMVLSRHYDGDPATAFDTILPNSILALITLPIWTILGLSLIHGEPFGNIFAS